MSCIKLQRYLSCEKLVWLLEDQGLFFAPASDQSDLNEGVYDHQTLAENNVDYFPNNPVNVDALANTLAGVMSNRRNHNFLSSWYIGEDESEVMWNEYAKDGVLLISNSYLLQNAIAGGCLKYAVEFKKIVYDDEMKKNEYHEALSVKDEKFEHEKEFRVLLDMLKFSLLTGFEKEKYGITDIGNKASYESIDIITSLDPECRFNNNQVSSNIVNSISSKKNGYIVKCNLSQIVSEIRTHPNCSEVKRKEIEDLCERNGLNVKVSASKLDI